MCISREDVPPEFYQEFLTLRNHRTHGNTDGILVTSTVPLYWVVLVAVTSKKTIVYKYAEGHVFIDPILFIL
jgi:hypothetical protein